MNKKLLRIFLIIGMTLLLTSCSDIPLKAVKGSGVTSAEQFKSYDQLHERKIIAYYKPFSLKENIKLPEEVEKLRVDLPTKELPFTVDDELGYIVSFKDENGNRSYEFQQSYVQYDDYGEISSFYTISIIPSSDNPLEKIDIEAGKDLVGNELKEQLIAGSTPFFEQKLTTDSALNYTFFEYDEETKNVHTVKTQANEFYTYNNGNIYHIGYFVDHERFNKRAHKQLKKLTKAMIF
ncbi:MAG TPA: hypothetical protein VK120_04370 [Sporosarcina sp.]|nr:hypothetical protein [Sporosarcina sp.]